MPKQICKTCGEMHRFQCFTCLFARHQADIKHDRTMRLKKLFNTKSQKFKGYIDDIASSYIDSAIEDVKDAVYVSDSSDSGIGVEPDEGEFDEDDEEPKLKLYEVRVVIDNGLGFEARLVTILATDSSEAMEHAEISLGVQILNIKVKSTWTELQGPFKNGQILAVREDDF